MVLSLTLSLIILIKTSFACNYVDLTISYGEVISRQPIEVCASGSDYSFKYMCTVDDSDNQIVIRRAYLDSNSCSGDQIIDETIQDDPELFQCDDSSTCAYAEIKQYSAIITAQGSETKCEKDTSSAVYTTTITVDECFGNTYYYMATCTSENVALIDYDEDDTCSAEGYTLLEYTAGCVETTGLYYEIKCSHGNRIKFELLLSILSFLVVYIMF